ncbi:2-oxoacid:acceptor oxidoreductase family protein [Halanaerobiaceae bacterium Z-7014]|uniref:2-oxoacid:acceptor oxidoreductase family protein n=1 Tax=Halonatronomonas betaini TaxID=2778430 RepID=A0A931ASV7_9FIRM|nr:2-oxoacid:acceptor oxidoreductase family protein [Halonatronomonas betaini]MBF8437539.1 2-oxoacid:acceptor oxidoreductase family protein [Halonatronomonas betaini]
MKQEIIMAGFGGQGVMSIGRLLAYAGMKEDKEVSWMPSYGPEMRGGTANCTVIVSDEKIPAPVSSHPDTAIVMNLPSQDKFGPKVKENGHLLVNSSLIEKEVDRDDINIINVPANEIADELGNTRVANMVMLGAYIAAVDIVSLDTVKDSLKNVLPERRHNLIPMNEEALDRGYNLV